MFALEEKLRICLFLLIWCPWAYGTETDDAFHSRESRAASPSLDCTFGAGICTWRHSSLERELKWAISQIIPDHTTGTSYYLRLYNDRKATRLMGRIQSPPVRTSGQTCLTFWYFMKEKDVGELSVFKIELASNEKHQMFSVVGSQGDQWYRALVPTGSGYFLLEIRGTIDNRWPIEGIGIDDISFSYEECPQSELDSIKYTPSVDCDFEEGLCSWYNTYEISEVEWRAMSASPDPEVRYPLPPYTDGKAVAGLVRLSESYNIEAEIQGPTFSVDSREACFSFWYTIQGHMVKQLQVQMTDYWYPHKSSTIYLSGPLVRPTWIQVNLTLSEREAFFITFGAMTHRGKDGAVLIDDVKVSHGGPCPEEKQEELINCDFDKDLCQWYLTTGKYDNDWARIKGPTPNKLTGPSHDHTTGDGHYVYFDASKLEKAYFYSQDIVVGSKGACFSFWYYMYGADVFTFELRVDKEPGTIETLWSLEGSQENKWLQQNISLSSFNEKRGRLSFKAESMYFPRGDIAIDDISITFGSPCESDIPEPTEPDEFEDSLLTELSVTTMSIPTPSTTEITELPTPVLILKEGTSTIYENSRVEFECQIHTNLTVGTKWYRQKEGKERMRPEMESGKSLVFDEIKKNERGIFACAITFGPDITSDLSNFVKLEVVNDPRRKPHLFISDPSQFLEVDKIVELSCGSIDIKGATYYWKTTSSAFVDSTLPNTREIVLNSTKREHSGLYSCRISKDEFMTGKSRVLKILVEPGKRCDYAWECIGDEYKPKCSRNRCKCHKNAVPVGPRCVFRPEAPKILTFPRFLEFGIGESFYVSCRAKTPAPPLMSYTFITSRGQIESHGVLKITQATERDGGYYQCFVTHNNVTSRHSNEIVVQIKDFTNLTCDFHKDFCKWSPKNDSRLSSFEHITSTDKERSPSSKHPGAYIQVPKSNSDVPSKAMLVSSTIDRTTLNCCLTFRYQMLGSEVRDLSVLTYKFAERLHEDGGTRLWSVIGEKGKHWHDRKITIPPGEYFYIAFEAIGPVAIADIRFVYRGGC